MFDLGYRLNSAAVLPYSIRQTVAPTAEPVTLADIKAHARVSIDDDDALITTLAIAAREYVERVTRRQLMTAQFEMRLNWWPADVWFTLPFPPLVSVESINFTDPLGNQNLWDASNYYVDTYRQPGIIQLAWNTVWPNIRGYHDSVIVAYTAGYAAGNVPFLAQTAIKELTALWYENREAANPGPALSELPYGLQQILLNLKVGGYP